MLNMVNIIHLMTRVEATCVLSGPKIKLLPKAKKQLLYLVIEFDKMHLSKKPVR